jgi:filamentous hemagglutinin family protein
MGSFLTQQQFRPLCNFRADHSILISGRLAQKTIPLGLGVALGMLWPALTSAQILPDQTLPNPSSVTTTGTTHLIEGGTVAGSNLFHSFSEFSVPTGTEAFFNNNLTIQNIFSRITGSKISNINGLLRANGSANLFLINPNGIIFGPNAQLNLGGSLIGTTANGIIFNDGSSFSATQPNSSSLLTINVPVGLQLGTNPGSIQVQNVGNSEIFPLSNPGLSVLPGKTLALIGGDVTFNGGILTVPSGRIEIGSLKNSPVNMISTPGGIIFDYSQASNFGNIQLLNRSSLFNPTIVENPFSGIQVLGGNITLNSSQIAALTPGGFNSGNIAINATESLTLKGNTFNYPFSSWIVNQVAPGAFGNSGEITVNTPQLTLLDGAVLQTLSLGLGNAGPVNVNADSLQISGSIPFLSNAENSAGDLSAQALNSRISSENNAGGATGNINVSSHQINLNAGGQITTRNGPDATGKGGNVTVNADRIIATSADRFRPIFVSGIGTYTIGASVGGNVNVSAGQITLLEGGEILSLTQGTGTAGNVTVNASESIVGRGVNLFASAIPSGIYSSTSASGNTGNIAISTPQLTLSEGAGATTVVFGQLLGNSGPGAGTGNAGNVNINAETIEMSGVSPLNPEGITQVGSLTFGSGNTGNVTISTRRLRVKDGASLILLVTPSLSAFGQPLPGSGTGTGGTLTVNATESVEVIGESRFLNNPSVIGTQTFGSGDVGEITVNTNRLSIQSGGLISSSTSATGDAGRVTVNAQNIVISGKGQVFQSSIRANAFVASESFQKSFFSPPIPEGNTGEVTVNADRMTIQDSGAISVEHSGIGNAGTLEVNSRELLLNQGSIAAQTAFGLGGDITLNTPDGLVLRDGSQITVEAFGSSGDGGNLTLNANTIVALENSLIRANAVGGNGGNIRISTQGLLISPDSQITASSQFGIDGVVEIQRPDVDPASGLVELSNQPVDPDTQIVTGCSVSSGSEFIVTGRGGIPEDPFQPLRGQVLWQDLRLNTEPTVSSTSGSKPQETYTIEQLSAHTQKQFTEATAWVKDQQGRLELIATVPSQLSVNINQCFPKH